MQTVVSVDLMRRSDEYTIKNYIDSKELMYRAGEGVFKSCNWQGKTAIVCGSGNNAGDGYVLALLLLENGFDCTLFLLKDKFSPDGEFYFKKCINAGVKWQLCSDDTDFGGYIRIVDCIFGTGFKDEATGLAADIIDKINSADAEVISVDINSGLNGDNGEAKKCVISDVTVSVGYVKSGFYLGDAKNKIKKIINCDIGIRLVEKGYNLVEKGDSPDCDLFNNAAEVEYPGGEVPVEALIELSRLKNIPLRSKNIITDGKKNTYIFE